MHGTADAKSQYHELVDAQMIHQAEMVVGMTIPGAINLEGTCGLAAIGVAKVGTDAAVFVLELVHRIDINSGKPDLESVEAGARPDRCSRAGAALGLAARDARPVLRQQYEGLGARACEAKARHHDGAGGRRTQT